jgi:type IV pilus assembly protein PilC
MEKYVYITQKKKGGPFVRGTVVADNVREAERDLMARELPVLSIDLLREKILSKNRDVRRHVVTRVTLADRLAFAQNMEQCQDIDMGLLYSLDICREMSQSKKFGQVCQRLKEIVAEGSTLHDAMRDTRVFDSLTLGLVRAGEKSGFLNRAFAQVKHNLRRTQTIRKKVIKLSVYPTVVMFVAALCVFFLMWKTVPTFVGLFASANLELPMPTKILMGISSFVSTYPFLVLAGLVGLAVGVVYLPVLYRKVPALHGVVLKLPIIGKLQKMLIQETFTRTLYNLLSAGVRIVDALSLCRDVSSCYPYKGAIARSMLAVSSGSPLMVSLEEEKDIFGIIVVRTLGFGEKTGKTEKVLEPLTETLSNDIMDYIDNLNTVIEPLLTLFIGGVVLLVLLALFIPIFNLPKLV